MTSTKDIAWAAGVFEGEGCFYVPPEPARKRKRGRTPSVTLVSTDYDTVIRLRTIVGVGGIHGPTIRPNRKPFWTWHVHSFEGVQHVIALFWSFLGIRRKAKAREALLANLDRRPPQRGSNHACATLDEDKVRKIRDARGSLTQQALGDLFGVSQGCVSLIQAGKTWAHVA